MLWEKKNKIQSLYVLDSKTRHIQSLPYVQRQPGHQLNRSSSTQGLPNGLPWEGMRPGGPGEAGSGVNGENREERTTDGMRLEHWLEHTALNLGGREQECPPLPATWRQRCLHPLLSRRIKWALYPAFNKGSMSPLCSLLRAATLQGLHLQRQEET